jgi:aryl-alcohol dehydrogenase-like predicted oxidoreductase
MPMTYGSVPGVAKALSRLVQGTAMLSSADLAGGFSLLDAVYDEGCRAFDTAHGYGQGDCERVLGRWLAERGRAAEVSLIGKGAHHNQDRQRVTPFDITADLHDSLARLRVERIELYLLHRDDPSVPVGPIVEVLNAHHRAGKIGAFGGSNWRVPRIQEANAYAKEIGLVPFAASSPHFSLAIQTQPPWPNCVSISGPRGQAERDWYRATRMPLFPWSSLAGGFFSGRVQRDNLTTFTSESDRLCVDTYASEENFHRLDRATQLAAELGLTVPQIATAYLMSQPLNLFALVGCQTGAEFAENVTALGTTLSPAQLAWLESGDGASGRR